jgi:hypothetical protein
MQQLPLTPDQVQQLLCIFETPLPTDTGAGVYTMTFSGIRCGTVLLHVDVNTRTAHLCRLTWGERLHLWWASFAERHLVK